MGHDISVGAGASPFPDYVQNRPGKVYIGITKYVTEEAAAPSDYLEIVCTLQVNSLLSAGR
jgi:hypothetical protein